MLEGYGIHTLIWDAADERLGEWLVASPADATGRGIELHVRQGGAAADLTGAVFAVGILIAVERHVHSSLG